MARVGLAFVACCVFAFESLAAAPEPAPVTVPAVSQQIDAPDAVPLEELREFAAVYAAIRASHVDAVDGKRLLHAAMVGMLRALDPHSEYYDAETLAEFDRNMRGRYAGIGVEVVTFAGILQVLAVAENSPASRGGVQPGDIIERIDGQASGASARDSDRLRGPLDSTLRLSLRREGRAEPIEIELKRAPVVLPSVESEWIEPGIAHIRISQVRERSALELRQHLARLGTEQKLRGIVLDLRGNPGGVVPAAVVISDSFLDSGRIVRTHSRLQELEAVFDAHPGDLAHGAAVVVLVDGATASAAELIAAALQENGRARVVGTRTFGKGSVQTVVPIESGGAIKLTTARYFTPRGRSLQSAGVVPDVDLAARRVRSADGRAVAPEDAEVEDDSELTAALRELRAQLTAARGRAVDSR